ncbi:MAG: hypothetical protein WBG42_02385 [Cryomorphaceae bacterium]
MKHPTKIFLLFLLICLSANSCKKEDDNNNSDEDSLAEYFYCDINGQRFNPTSNFNCNGRLFGYTPESEDGISAGYLVISGKNCPAGELLGLRFYNLQPTEGEINFLNPVVADSCSPFFKSTDDEVYDVLLHGNASFEHFEPRVGNTKGLIEGTFDFSVAHAETDSVVTVTNGYFRFRIEHTW